MPANFVHRLRQGRGSAKNSGDGPSIPSATESSRTEQNRSAAVRDSQPMDDAVVRLDTLRRRGQFSEFVDEAMERSTEPVESPARQLLRAEALLAMGLHDQAAATTIETADRSLAEADAQRASQALKLWAVARLRQRAPLDDWQIARLMADMPPEDATVRLIRFWSESLGGRAAYRTASSTSVQPLEIPRGWTEPNSAAAELNAIRTCVNGVTLPLAFVDSGSQYTVMTVAAAERAGVKTSECEIELVGFTGTKARTGLVDTLALGDLVLHDVPVLVGDSRALVAVAGDMALGMELAHHVRFTLDYPHGKVFAAPAGEPSSAAVEPTPWRIPLWTFSQSTLTHVQLAGGASARVLLDTCNRGGTFVSARCGAIQPARVLVAHVAPCVQIQVALHGFR